MLSYAIDGNPCTLLMRIYCKSSFVLFEIGIVLIALHRDISVSALLRIIYLVIIMSEKIATICSLFYIQFMQIPFIVEHHENMFSYVQKRNKHAFAWWRHQMGTFSALLALCVGNPPVTGEFPSRRPVTRSFDVSLIWGWFNGWVNNREAGDSRHHCAHCNVIVMI